ncbi:MAG: hypothetical protein IPK19_05010 [Chloroflexi bacterium]|nr:hypothetical protein [Chloroflexota bacterium]
MMQNVEHAKRENSIQIWVLAFGSIAVWFAHFVYIYAVVDFGCAAGLPDYVLIGAPAIRLLVIAGTVVASALLIALGIGAFSMWRRSRDNHEEESARLRTFAGLLGIGLGITSLAVVLLSTVPVFVLAACPGAAGA